MAQLLLILGESGTGKTCSLRNCDPAKTAIVSPTGKALPFKTPEGGFETLSNTTDAATICEFIREQVINGKDLIILDDMQYILIFANLARAFETGYTKFTEFAKNYTTIIQACAELPQWVTVVFMSHTENNEGIIQVKTTGRFLRETLSVEGMFTTVLRTVVQEGRYGLLTQNNGHDTVKSPLGMFDSDIIDNDLLEIIRTIKQYYDIKPPTPEELEALHKVAAEEEAKPSRRRRRVTQKELGEQMTRSIEANTAVHGEVDEIPFEEAVEVS